jgi:hypothetical protein
MTKAFKIYGKVVEKETGKGIPDLTVKAVDKDLFFDDLLGAVTTDENGNFEIKYDKEDFLELFFDKKPDVYLKIKNPDGEVIHTTEDKVRYGAGETEEYIVKISKKILGRDKMTDYRKEIESIKNPENIQEAIYASGPNALMKAFKRDPTVGRLIEGGRKVVPLIAEEIEKNGLKLDEITLSCFAFILQKVDLDSATKILKPLFIQAMKEPNPFFVNFAAHALRQGLRLPVKPSDPLYTRGELLETLERVKI